jgi:hypothetical protein
MVHQVWLAFPDCPLLYFLDDLKAKALYRPYAAHLLTLPENIDKASTFDYSHRQYKNLSNPIFSVCYIHRTEIFKDHSEKCHN